MYVHRHVHVCMHTCVCVCAGASHVCLILAMTPLSLCAAASQEVSDQCAEVRPLCIATWIVLLQQDTLGRHVQRIW